MMMKSQMNKRSTQALGEAYVNVMTTPNAYVRFWIITILLVLLGLATLKLR